jgi:hypothetical protein
VISKIFQYIQYFCTICLFHFFLLRDDALENEYMRKFFEDRWAAMNQEDGPFVDELSLPSNWDPEE